MRRELLIVLIVVATTLSCAGKGGDEGKAPNPAAVYCTGLGYRYKVSDTDKGQVGYCILNKDKCEAWSFLNGKCGQSHTYCEMHGGRIRTTAENCSFSRECAICILPDGTECHEWD